MRQGLGILVLLGAAIGVETLLAPGPSWIRSAVRGTQWTSFSLVTLILLLSLWQRMRQIGAALEGSSRHGLDLLRLLRSTPHGPFLVLHGGLVLLILAVGYAKNGSLEAVMELPVGGEGRVAVLDDGRRVTLPFTVRATAFDTEHYPSGEVRQFVGGVELAEGDRIVVSQPLTVGDPLDYRGYRFSLFRYGYRGSRVTGSIRPVTDPVRWTTYDAIVGSNLTLPDGTGVILASLEEHTTRRTPDGDRDIGRGLVYEMPGRDGTRYEVMSYESASHVVDFRRTGAREFTSINLLRDRAEAVNLPFDHYLTVASVEPSKTIGLQIRYYPGLRFLLFSAALVVAGVAWMLRFWRPPVAMEDAR